MGRFSLPVEENKRIIKEALGKFDTVNIDMVWGIPGDTVNSIIHDAVESFKLGVDQCCCPDISASWIAGKTFAESAFFIPVLS